MAASNLPTSVPASHEDRLLFASLLEELREALASADPDIEEVVRLELETVEGIVERLAVEAGDLMVLETLRDYAWEEYTTIEDEMREDGIELSELDFDNPDLIRYEDSLSVYLMLGNYLAAFGYSGKVGEA